MKIIPRNGLVTVRLIEPRKDTMVGKIILPSSQGNQFQMAEVIAVGPGTPDYGVFVGTEDLHPGQTVLVKTGTQVEIGQTIHNYIDLKDAEGRPLAVLNQQDIMAIIEEDDLDDAGDVVEVGLDADGNIDEDTKADTKADNNEGENHGAD